METLYKNLLTISCILNQIDWVLVVTFITALATFYTVLEMKKQRVQSNMPNLILRNEKRFYLYKDTTINNFEYLHWHDTRLTDTIQIESKAYHKFDIDLFNIGVGTAKNIRFSYKIDDRKIINVLHSIGEVKVETLDLEKNGLSFEAKYGIVPLGFSIAKSDICYSEIFIPREDNSFKLKLPSIYLSMFNAFVLSLTHKQNKTEYFDKFPSLKLSIVYQDIANNSYKKQFEFKFKLDTIHIEPSCVSGLIIIEELT